MRLPRCIVALDLSAPIGSAVWLERDEPVVEIEWPQPPRDSRTVFQHLKTLLLGDGRHPDYVDAWAVGCGPGAYSGLRIALAAIRMFAAPLQRPTIGVDSGLAVADELLMRLPVDDAVVAGDARRGLAWYGQIRRADCGLAQLVAPWTLCPLHELDSKVPAAGCGGSAEWSQLASVAQLNSAEGKWWPEDLVPRARHIARRARLLLLGGHPLPPPRLIYVQPPVGGRAEINRGGPAV